MQITDPIADLLTRIRNASSSKHETVDVPASNMKKAIVEILNDEGYIKDFQVIDGKIMPALTSIDGMGEKAAQQVEEAAKGEPFTSLENFRNRTKAPQACIEKMKELGIMGDLSDTDQLSFDFL